MHYDADEFSKGGFEWNKGFYVVYTSAEGAVEKGVITGTEKE